MTSTAVAMRDKDPKAVQRSALKGTLEKFSDSFARVLPKHLTPDRMVQLALVAATKNPAILSCTPESIALAVMQISQWGLDIGRTAHLVPFGNTCTAIADWKGLVQLMKNSGHVRDVKANAVYANEVFRVIEGANETLEHHRVYEESARGALVAVYAIAWLKHGRATWDVMGVDEVERIRKGARSGNSDAWKKHYDEMAKKTAVRRLAKRMPQTPELQSALTVEELENPAEAMARLASSLGVSEPIDQQRRIERPVITNSGYTSEPEQTLDEQHRPVPAETTITAETAFGDGAGQTDESPSGEPIDCVTGEPLSEAGRWEMPMGDHKGAMIGTVPTDRLVAALDVARGAKKYAGFVAACETVLEDRRLASAE